MHRLSLQVLRGGFALERLVDPADFALQLPLGVVQTGNDLAALFAESLPRPVKLEEPAGEPGVGLVPQPSLDPGEVVVVRLPELAEELELGVATVLGLLHPFSQLGNPVGLAPGFAEREHVPSGDLLGKRHLRQRGNGLVVPSTGSVEKPVEHLLLVAATAPARDQGEDEEEPRGAAHGRSFGGRARLAPQ